MRNRLHCVVALILGLALTGTALALTLPDSNTVKSPATAACGCPDGTCPADGSCCGCAGGIKTAVKKAACCCPQGSCPADGSCCGCTDSSTVREVK